MYRRQLLFFTVSTLIIIGCHRPEAQKNIPGAARKIPNKFAQLFDLYTTKTDTLVHIYGQNQRPIGQYFWGKSEILQNHIKITRGNTYVTLSAVFARMIHELNLGDCIKGIDNRSFIPKDIKLHKNCNSLQQGGILNKEALLQIKPQITFTYLLDGSGEQEWKRLQHEQHCVVFIQSHLESHPLARAEWIRAVGWILGKPKLADSLYQQIETSYIELKSSNTDGDPKTVMLNLPFEGIWHIPNDSAYFTQILRDAHFNPSWLIESSHSGIGASSISMEDAIQYIQKSSYWLNLGSIKDISEITQIDARLAEVTSKKSPNIFQNDKQIELNGANSFWDLGTVHPELILKDLILMQKDTSSEGLYFYRKL